MLHENKQQLTKLQQLYDTFVIKETPIAVALKTLIDGMQSVLKHTKSAASSTSASLTGTEMGVNTSSTKTSTNFSGGRTHKKKRKK